MNIIAKQILSFFGIRAKHAPVISAGKYVPFSKLPKVEQFKINHQLIITRDEVRHARKQRNLDKVRTTLLSGLEKGFSYDVKDFVHKYNSMPDPQLMLDNYATIPGFISVFDSAGITETVILQMLNKLTGNSNANRNTSTILDKR